MAIEDKKITKGNHPRPEKSRERNSCRARTCSITTKSWNQVRRSTACASRCWKSPRRQSIWKMIGDAIRDAVDKYVTQDFVAATASEWRGTKLRVISTRRTACRRDHQDLEQYIKDQARPSGRTTWGSNLEEISRGRP